MIKSISAVTLATHDMPRAVRFYRALGFDVVYGGNKHTFDSFECAIHMLAPTCPHCDCKVVGHGVEAGGQIYCCVHCAEESGAHGLKDRS